MTRASAATPRPWAQHRYWPTEIVPSDHADWPSGGSSVESRDATYATQIAICCDDNFAKTGWPHRITREQAIANATLIVHAVNAYDDLIEALGNLIDAAEPWESTSSALSARIDEARETLARARGTS